MARSPVLLLVLVAMACGSDVESGAVLAGSTPTEPSTDSGSPPDHTDIPPVTERNLDGWAKQCVAVRLDERWLASSVEGDAYTFGAEDLGSADAFFLQASDLGTYLFYDADGGYLLSEGGTLERHTTLESDITRVEDGVIDDGYVSGAEWQLEASPHQDARYQLRNRRTSELLAVDGTTADEDQAVAIVLDPAEGCREHPELGVDATGTVARTTWEDGALYGIVDTHSHMMSNFGFGGGVFHGSAYHRLGVEHALPDCDVIHGEMGRKDFFGYVYDTSGNNATDVLVLTGDMLSGELSVDNHATDGYPTFSEWPDARQRSTHNTQYYRWLERAWMSGLRLVVNHGTSNAVMCNLMVGEGIAPQRYDCEDMTAIDRSIDETWQMQRYIDAQSGGEGKGWFRVVRTPAEARQVISEGKLAVVLGIETSDLFDCHITPRPGEVPCDPAYVDAQLDAYYERGVRVLFPVHKYDNQFAPGDGSRDFLELGNFLNSGHWTNKTEDCPDDGLSMGFDGGSISFGGLLEPRDDFLGEPPNDLSGFPDDPLLVAFGFLAQLLADPIEGNFCQNAGFTDLGEHLMAGMMARGMIIEIDHLSAWSYRRALELLQEHDYPAVGTHGRNADGLVYALGGTSIVGVSSCQDPDNPGSTLGHLQDELALIETMGGYPAVGFGLDLNGFAGAHGPRFGEGDCSQPQDNPITYPFTSYAGDVEFTEPFVGERAIDFGTEGLVHIGLMPEMLEDARSDAVDDADLEPLFRSAEAYVRMWEKAERRAAELAGP